VNSKHLTAAIAACEQALSNQAENPHSWQLACRDLGNILQGLGRFDESIQWHSFALENQLNLREVYFYLGKLHANEENWLEAIAALQNVLADQPDSAIAYSSLAQIYGRLGQKEAEIDCWYRALNLNPDLSDARGYHKLAKALQEKGKIEAAITCYQRAIERNQNFLASYYELAEIWLQQGQLEEATSYYQTILAHDRNQARAYHKLGSIYLQQNQYEEAIAALRQAIQIEPQFPWAYRELVKTFIKLERWDEAIATCHAIINLVEEFPWVYVHLGNALRQKGRVADAVSAFQKACKLRNWHQCVTNNYHFTEDRFTYRIPVWTSHLQSFVGKPELKILEIGSFQGMSTCWLLDNVLTHASAKLTCVADNFSELFTANLFKTGGKEKVTQLVGNVPQLLASLSPETYDVINFQSKCKLSDRLQQDVTLAWQTLKWGGIALFNDYGWTNPANEAQNPKLGIDQFLDTVKGQWEIVRHAPQAYQLIVQKKESG
jgi:tetratricopeptide (TPR) repeat protein/predicted O-methyltransferase YrrM